jgi:hypothetical protein
LKDVKRKPLAKGEEAVKAEEAKPVEAESEPKKSV